MTKTQRVWVELMKEMRISRKLWLPCWKQVVEGYSAANRHYHTFQHIDRLLTDIDRFGNKLLMPGAVRLAAIYHDARDSEEASAQLALEALRSMGMPDEWTAAIWSLVMCTQGHRPIDNHLAADSAILSDCDLLILATPAARYDAYTRKIRREYSHYDDAKFRAGRKSVLESFSQRSPIYLTPEIHARYEQKAIANLRREIAQLS